MGTAGWFFKVCVCVPAEGYGDAWFGVLVCVEGSKGLAVVVLECVFVCVCVCVPSNLILNFF